MPLFVIFIFGAVIIGTGAMLSPALPTTQPRIGLAAALGLGLVMGGSVVWSMLFGWDTLVINYILFALVTSIFLFGTLSYGQKRAEKRGEELLDADQGWTSGRDLLLFLLAALIFVIPALLLPVPLDTDAQGFGYLALMARLGGSFQTLAPFHPEVSYLYAPGLSLLSAYLSGQLLQTMNNVQFGIGAVLAFMLIWLAYDFGSELQNKRLGRAMALAMLIGVGTLTAYMDSHYTTLLALVFAFAFLIFVLRYLKYHYTVDAIFGGLMLGSVVLSHPDTTIILGLGFIPWLATMWFGNPRPTLRAWLVIAIALPLIALIAVLPWLSTVLPLLGAEIVSPFERDAAHWTVMIVYHGILIVPIALLGAVVGIRQRSTAAFLAVGWLLLALDFSTTGIIPTLLGGLLAPVLRYDYPFSIAWHAPIIPYTILGGIALLWLWDRFGEARFGVTLHRVAPIALAAASGVLVLGGVFTPQLAEISKDQINFFGAFSSRADVAAMDWLRTNTPEDAIVLNHPAPHEADWAPVIAERNTIYFRPQPFFQGMEAVVAEQERLRAFWDNPADPANADLLQAAGVDYVIVPQIVTNPNSIETMYRWRAPFTADFPMQSAVADAPYLELVYDQDGAQVYQVVESSQ